MRKSMVLALLIPLLGCGDRGDADVDFGGEDIGPDRHAIFSEDGELKMGLTDRYVYFGLSEEAIEEARSEMRGEGDGEGEGFFSGLLERTVGRALGFRAKVAVEEIEDIRWEDGGMRIVFADPDRSFGDSFRVNDRPATEAFTEEEVREFAAAFRELKEGQTAETETAEEAGIGAGQ